MDNRKVLFSFTLTFSILLEIWVRFIMPITHGQDGFGVWPPVDNVMHFFWGLNLFLALVIFLKRTPLEGLLGVYGWQMIWELCEMLGDHVLNQPSYMLDHFFFDGIKDTLVDVAGGLLAWFLLSRTKERFKGVKKHPRFTRFLVTHLVLMLPLLPVGAFLLIRNGTSADVLAIAWISLAAPVAYVVYVVPRIARRRARRVR